MNYTPLLVAIALLHGPVPTEAQRDHEMAALAQRVRDSVASHPPDKQAVAFVLTDDVVAFSTEGAPTQSDNLMNLLKSGPEYAPSNGEDKPLVSAPHIASWARNRTTVSNGVVGPLTAALNRIGIKVITGDAYERVRDALDLTADQRTTWPYDRSKTVEAGRLLQAHYILIPSTVEVALTQVSWDVDYDALGSALVVVPKSSSLEGPLRDVPRFYSLNVTYTLEIISVEEGNTDTISATFTYKYEPRATVVDIHITAGETEPALYVLSPDGELRSPHLDVRYGNRPNQLGFRVWARVKANNAYKRKLLVQVSPVDSAGRPLLPNYRKPRLLFDAFAPEWMVLQLGDLPQGTNWKELLPEDLINPEWEVTLFIPYSHLTNQAPNFGFQLSVYEFVDGGVSGRPLATLSTEHKWSWN